MTWVKVCGLSRPEEIQAAAAAGADAVGFVSVPGSPRFLALDAVGSLVAHVPEGVTKVLLTLDLDADALLDAVSSTGVDGVQPYGRHRHEAATAAVSAGLFVLMASRPSPDGVAPRHPAGTMPLFDAPADGLLGGSGTAFDWSPLESIEGDFVVAGGLGPDNVAALIDQVDPWGVDASSRLESEPGLKDLGKVADFVREAKRR